MDIRPIITTKGIVIAAGWEHNGEISTVDIAGFDEKRYRVANNAMGSQLRHLLQHTITVQGELVVDNQLPMIIVHHLHIHDPDGDSDNQD